MFGICLGHQLLGLASDAKTVKMKFGHHGANHPVLDIASGRVLISSQNHGFAVDETTLGANVQDDAQVAVRRIAAGHRAHGPSGLQLPGPSRGESGPARRALRCSAASSRMIHDRLNAADRRQRRRPPRRRRLNKKSNAQANRHSKHPDHRRGSHRHRSGMRVRLLRRTGLQGAEGRGLPRHPREFESRDDHDRSGDRRRRLHRAGQLAHRRAHHRKGAAERAAADDGRADSAQLRARSGARGRAREIRRRADRRVARSDRHG